MLHEAGVKGDKGYSLTKGNDKTNNDNNTIQCQGHRREFLNRVSILITSSSTISLLPDIAQAAVTSSSSSALYNEIQQRLPLGHARVKYLLDHWDDITSICGTSVMSDIERKQIIRTEGGGGSGSNGDAGGCIKTPLRVQEFMGYKSINDPLYRIDKLLIKADTFVNANDYDNYIDTVEQYRTTADATALLAYTSSWGEANPNGSKEVIEEYLDQTKAQVIVSEQLLRNILQYLNLQSLPPIQGKL